MRNLAVLMFSMLAAACGAQAIGPGASGAHPPPPRAGQAISEWEHYCVWPQRDFDTVLTEAGTAGWEMVGVSGVGDSSVLLCFKRPVAEVAPDPGPPSETPPASE